MDSKKVVSLYHQSHEADRFEVGFVESVDRNDVTLQCLTPRGEEDGHMSVRIEDVTAIEIDDPYSQKIQTLFTYRGSIFNERESARVSTSSPSLEEQLQAALDNHRVVTVEDTSGTRFTGFVRELTDGYVEVELLNQFGAPDGRAFVARHMLGKVDIGRRDEQTRAFLYKVNHELRRLLD